MNEKQPWQLADDLETKLSDFKKINDVLADAQLRLGSREPDTFALYAAAAILHDLYNGIENICRWIVKEIDQRQKIGPSWHRQILDQVSEPVPKLRPTVLQNETVVMLHKYLGFRHRFRNIYGFELDWAKMKPLFDEAPTMIALFTSDVEQFVIFLRAFDPN